MSFGIVKPIINNLISNVIPSVGIIPTDLANLKLWTGSQTHPADPSFVNFIFNGSNISTWFDRSVNNNDLTQTTATRQPLFVSSGTVNNLPSVRFDGTTDFLNGTIDLRDTVSSDRTMFFTNKVVAGSASAGTWYAYNVSKDVVAYDSAGNSKHFDGTTFRTLLTADVRTFAPFVYTITVQGTTMKSFRDLAPQATITIARPGGATSFTIGATSQPLKFWQGDMTEIVMYDRLLPPDETLEIQNYLIGASNI